MKPYKTLLTHGQNETVINKSRFIGQAIPARTPEEALAFIASVRAQYPDATHHCFAYVIGENAGIMRYSDDGEPGGTAGLPMMEVLKARGVVNCVVVVTRYFGGTLLGAGGLVRAYSHSCAMALNAAGVCVMEPTERWLCEVAYPLWDKVNHALKSMPIRLVSTDFAAAVSFELETKAPDSADVRHKLTQLTAAQIEMLLEEESYSPWLEETSPEV